MPSRLKQIVRAFAPPILYEAASYWKQMRQSDTSTPKYMPNGWQDAAKYRGWNAESVLEAYRATWPRLIQKSQTTEPLNLVMGSPDPVFHNVLLCFAYSLALAAQGKPSLSLLDWGGAIGQYKLLAQAALPGIPIDYYCKDVPLLAEYGQQINPDAHFSSDDSCLGRSYDFVLASSSLHYLEHWQSALKALANSTRGYLLLTRTPVNDEGRSFVFSQSAYGSEYLAWSLNRRDLLNCAEAAGLVLVREFALLNAITPILNAPHPSQQRGYLFRSAQSY